MTIITEKINPSLCSFITNILYMYYLYTLIQVSIDFPSGSRVFKVRTPSRKAAIKQYARRCYHAVAATTVKSAPTSSKVLREIALRIKREMNELATVEHHSILQDNVEAVKHFSWETVILELRRKVPTLMHLLAMLVKKTSESSAFMASLACQILKDQHPKLGLMQRAVSVMLYSYGTSKQVSCCFLYF